MSTTQTSPFMKLKLPKPGVGGELGPTWAQDLFDALNDGVDSHDHSGDKGTKVTPAGMDITADLSFLGSEGANHNLTDLRSARLAALAGAIGSDPADRRALFVVGGDLYYIDGDGNVVQITLAGAINVAGVGGISGMSGGAAVAYTALSKTFVFIQAANTPANLDAGTMTIREAVLNGNGVNLKAHAGLAASFDWTFPAALPGAKSILTIDGAGNVATQTLDYSIAGPGVTVGYARAVVNAAASGGNFISNQAVAIPLAESNVVVSKAYTAKKIGNKLRVRAVIPSAASATAGADVLTAALFVDAGSSDAVFAVKKAAWANEYAELVAEHEYTVADLAAHTYKAGVAGEDAGGCFWLTLGAFGAKREAFIEITEIAQ